MWVDEHGVAHTVALPKPKVLMTKSFRGSLKAVVRSNPEAVGAALETAEEQCFEYAVHQYPRYALRMLSSEAMVSASPEATIRPVSSR